MHSVVFELVSHVVSGSTSVDDLEVTVGVVDHDARDETTDATEAIDAHGIATHGGLGSGHTTGRAKGGRGGDQHHHEGADSLYVRHVGG